MSTRQPWGIYIGGGVLVIFGGLTSLVTFFEIIDSIRFYGLASLFIVDPVSLAGFLVYGFTPAFLYSCGVGLFMKREWARQSTVLLIPILLLLFFFNQSINVTRFLTGSHRNVIELLKIRSDVCLIFLAAYLVLILPMIFYFTRPSIKSYFLQQQNSLQ